MPDVSFGKAITPTDLIRFAVEPEVPLRLGAEQKRGVGSPARPDEGVPGVQLIPEPGRELAAVQAVEPERDGPQLNRDRVLVDPEAIPVCDLGPDPLLLEDDILLRDGPAHLFLLALEI